MIRPPFFGRFVAGAVMVCAVAAPTRAQSALEYDVKAALLLNFARFIEWPDAAFEGAEAPIDVCVLTPSPFGQALERALTGETVANRSLSAREVQGVSDGAGCHLLFVPAGAESRAGALFRDAGPHTVTVGESRRFENMGGAVTLVIEGGRVRFNVNLRPVERRSIRISARMLQLAGRVDRATPEK
jgi:hypothetical protein